MLQSIFLMEGLTPDEVQRCLAMASIEERSFEKGESIYDSKSSRRALAYIVEGHVRVSHGKVVMNDLYPGNIFGAAALFGSSDPYPSVVVAASACRIAFISQETVSLWMASVPQIAENYVRFLSDRIRFLNRRLSTLTAGPADGKLWRYLLAHKDENNAVKVVGGMSMLAERLDMGRSSLYRSLDLLMESGRIRREGKIIYIIDMEE